MTALRGSHGSFDPIDLPEHPDVGQSGEKRALPRKFATSRGSDTVVRSGCASVRKLLGVEHDQRTQEVGLGILGRGGLTDDGATTSWLYGFLANRCLSIAGGTSEIQRNVIGERLLGLPRD